ncbi:MAG: purine-nucleoside phosphorylase, partial [Bacteroidales bacterium]|nr:purine-nucleoside phosphorylase [Bacteroidales bacterium]
MIATINETLNFLKSRNIDSPKTGIILGTG